VRGSGGRGVLGLVALRVRKNKRPEKDDRFMIPKSPFEGIFEPNDGYGTYEAEMKALDKVRPREKHHPLDAGEGKGVC
jgi:hypothetical protein